METKLEVDISRALQIEGWTSEAELQWLAEQARNLPLGAEAVEIGTFKGRSARAIVDYMDFSQGGRLYCVDPYETYPDPGVADAATESWDSVFLVASRNLSGVGCMVVQFRESSTRAALRFHDQTIDMIFIDGDHSYSSVLADITAWERTVKPGGLICGHDYNVHPGVKPAVDESFQFGRIKFPVGSIWAVRKP